MLCHKFHGSLTRRVTMCIVIEIRFFRAENSSGPYAGFSEGGFEMENLVTENKLSLQVDPS